MCNLATMMKRKSTMIIFFTAIFLFCGVEVQAQKPGKQKSVKKQQKEFIKLQNDRESAANAELEANKKKHAKRQDKAAQKRMKKNKKKMRRLKKDKHQDSFFQRMFRKKPKR